MLAQRYPEAYDGIAAAAPAFHWAQFIPAAAWAQVNMAILGQFPSKCELDFLTSAAIAACDQLDGTIHGLISDPTQCFFDPFSMVGEVFECPSNNQTAAISNASATIANLTWTGPRKGDGSFLWHGLEYQARLTGSGGPPGTTSDLGYASVTCDKNDTCVGSPTLLGEDWLWLFVKKDADWDFTRIETIDEYALLFHASVQQYASIIGTADADLS